MVSRLLAPLLLLCSGCASYVALDVNSTPPGAMVLVRDQVLGTTPTGVLIYETSERMVQVTLEKMGFKPVSVVLTFNAPYATKEEARQKPGRVDRYLKPR